MQFNIFTIVLALAVAANASPRRKKCDDNKWRALDPTALGARVGANGFKTSRIALSPASRIAEGELELPKRGYDRLLWAVLFQKVCKKKVKLE
ncbi:hypothetical protein Moror_1675 [Moniliophthora roreri MCA 2997]|uniref:Uncharacterized protein n=1 Tax=Moniliophthora roreri (strain MCA 2997) TaxID=1381753 RepID=V2X2X5_MONRO|nr:hypothetical protein Moror_1675 [Moniliophthora roreri MCA 2997]